MTNFLRFFIPFYFIVYFLIAFVLKSYIVSGKIGKNPVVLQNDDSAYALVGFYFKLIIVTLFAYSICYGLAIKVSIWDIPAFYIEVDILKYLGLLLLVIAFVFTLISQAHLNNSWRIGIDTETKTELITNGIYSYSRNPIFGAMILSLCGLFLLTPNGATIMFLVLGYVLIQIQVRLEEAFLTKEHGQDYLNYKNKVRRYI